MAAGFHPDLTGRENVFLQGAIMGMRRAEIAARFDEIVEFAGLERFIDTPVKRYSSGMNARLGFSIAAHLEPGRAADRRGARGGRHGLSGEMPGADAAVPETKAWRSCSCRTICRRWRSCAARYCCSRTGANRVRFGAPGRRHRGLLPTDDRARDERRRDQRPRSVRRHDEHGGDGVRDRAGRAVCTLDVTLDFQVDVERATIGIVVWDLTRELYVYGASSDFVGIRRSAPAGASGAPSRSGSRSTSRADSTPSKSTSSTPIAIAFSVSRAASATSTSSSRSPTTAWPTLYLQGVERIAGTRDGGIVASRTA